MNYRASLLALWYTETEYLILIYVVLQNINQKWKMAIQITQSKWNELVWLSSSDMMCKEGFKYYRSACNCQPVLSYLNGIDHFITNLKEAKWSSLFNKLVNTTIFKLTLSTSISLWWLDPRGIFRWLVSNLIRLSDLYNLEYKTVIF